MGVKINAQGGEHSEYVQAIYDISRILLKRGQRPWLFNDKIFNLTKMGRKQAQCLKVLHGFTNKVIQERKSELLQAPVYTKSNEDEVLGSKQRKAFLDMLLETSLDGKGLSDEAIREEVDTFMFEGHDTTTAGITWVLFLLGAYPQIQEKVAEELNTIFEATDRPITVRDCQEMKYLERVIKEALRLYPSVPFIMRTIEEDTQIGDYKLPDGSTVIMHIYSVHRDPEYFPNPEEFNPDNFLPERVQGRHPYAYIPFSAGPRNCIGQKFAMLEEKTILATVVRNFKIRSLEKRENINLLIELILRPESGTQVVLTKR